MSFVFLYLITCTAVYTIVQYEKYGEKKHVKFFWGVFVTISSHYCDLILQTLFSCLVQYFADLALQQPPQLQLMDKLVPHLYQLCQGSQVSAAQVLVDQITERQEEFQAICDSRKGRGLYPALDTVSITMYMYVEWLTPHIGSLMN